MPRVVGVLVVSMWLFACFVWLAAAKRMDVRLSTPACDAHIHGGRERKWLRAAGLASPLHCSDGVKASGHERNRNESLLVDGDAQPCAHARLRPVKRVRVPKQCFCICS